jgi:protein SCO1/2
MRAIPFVLLAFACSGRPKPHDAPPPPATSAASAPSRVGTGPSLYDLSIPLTSAGGVRIGLDVDRGHPTLVSMFYGSCPAACPLLIETIGRTLEQLPPAARDDVRVVLVSFDPARDTPDRLRALARTHRLDGRWTLAAASDADARTLAAVLGIRYRAVAGGQFVHTSAIVALDRDGRAMARLDGLGDTAALAEALAAQRGGVR